MKNNKILIGIIIVLGCLVLGLSGYLVYDKVLTNDKPNEKTPIINNDEEIYSLNEVYTKLKYNDIVNDNTLLYKETVRDLETKANINYNEKYSNITYSEDNFKFVFNCLATDTFGANDEIECSEREIIVNDNVKISLNYQLQYLFITKRYTIIQMYDQQANLEEIIIYNNENGEKELSLTNSYLNGEIGIVKINNNTLYYISADSESINSLSTSTVDLSNDNLKTEILDSYKIKK